MCERFVDAAARSCKQAAPPVAQPQPEWDALANSFASLSNAFAWGALLLGFLAVVAGVAWGLLVRVWAEREARAEAAECVKRQMDAWLAEEAPTIIRQHVESLQNASLGTTPDEEAADEIGKEAG